MTRWIRYVGAALLPLVLGALGCNDKVQCGEGTEPKFNTELGLTVCTGKIPQKFVQCDPNTASIIAGVCTADAAKFPKCGDGTMLDKTSNTCVPMMGTCGPQPPPCPPQPGKFSIKGVITHFKDGAYATGEMVEVRAYNPILFILNPGSATPQAKLVTTDSTYCFDNLTDDSGQGLIAIAVTDPNGPTNWSLAGVGQDMVAPGATFRTDAYIVEKSLVASWDMQAGRPAGSFEMAGAYIGRFLDHPRTMEAGAGPVAGVVLQQNSADAPGTFYFGGSLAKIDKALTATDGQTGAAINEYSGVGINQFSGKGGMIGGKPVTWDSFPGASAPGVVFIQKFHPAM